MGCMGGKRLPAAADLASQNPNVLPHPAPGGYPAAKMRLTALVSLLLAACLAARAADPAPTPVSTPEPTPTPASSLIPSVALKDGRVLHNVKIMDDEPDSIVVHANEGLIKVAKSDLPPGIAKPAAAVDPLMGGPDMVMQPFDPNRQPAEDPEVKAIQKMTPPPKTPVPKVGPATVYKGCTIVSFEKKTFMNIAGCAEVVIRNDTDSPQIINPHDVFTTAATGARYLGRIFYTDGFPPQMKRREIVPAQGQIDDILTFSNDDFDMTAVQWAH